MKKILVIIFIAAFAITIVACGGQKTQTQQNVVDSTAQYKVQVLEQMGDGSWVLNGTRIADVNGEKSIIFVGMGVAEDQQAARDLAILNAQAAAATAIRSLATRQIARAWERVGIPGKTEEGEQVTRGLEASVSKNVNVSGLLVIRHYYRLVKKPTFARPFYEWYSELALNYDKYKELRDGVIKQNQRSYRLNQRQQVLYRQTEQALQELNKMDGERDGGIPNAQVELSPEQKTQRTEAVPGGGQ